MKPTLETYLGQPGWRLRNRQVDLRLTRTAGIDWRWGAAWFEQHLLDYDVGPNWGNWQYVAGVGNDPRNRIFNVRAQAERYDPEGAYRARWLGATRLAAGDLTSGTPAISSTIRP